MMYTWGEYGWGEPDHKNNRTKKIRIPNHILDRKSRKFRHLPRELECTRMLKTKASSIICGDGDILIFQGMLFVLSLE